MSRLLFPWGWFTDSEADPGFAAPEGDSESTIPTSRVLFLMMWGSDLDSSGGLTTNAPVWAHFNTGLAMRTYGTRVRGQDVWTQTGSAWNDDPMTDTRDR